MTFDLTKTTFLILKKKKKNQTKTKTKSIETTFSCPWVVLSDFKKTKKKNKGCKPDLFSGQVLHDCIK